MALPLFVNRKAQKMPRAMLRSDYREFYSPDARGVRLDDDTRSSVPARLGYDPIVPKEPDGNGSLNPTVTVRERISDGYDDAGNARWSWIPIIEDVAAVSWLQREETSDRANSAHIVGEFTILYPRDYPDVRETATVESNGQHWSVTGVERFPDRIVLYTERIDDES